MMISVFDGAEDKKILVTTFSPFPTMFNKAFFFRVVKTRDCNVNRQMPSLLPNNITLDWSKLKALADDMLNVTEILKFDLERVENIVGKEKMLVASIFSFPHNVFKWHLFQGRKMSGFCGKEFKMTRVVVKLQYTHVAQLTRAVTECDLISPPAL